MYTGRIVNLDRGHGSLSRRLHGPARDAAASGRVGGRPLLDDIRAADPRVLLIRQFRHAADRFIWEVPPAGSTRASRRKLRRAGAGGGNRHEGGRLEKLTTIFTTPGFTDERIHLFAAYDLVEGKARREATSSWSCIRGDGRR